MTIYSKITTKAQTVIPKEVRKRLHLKPGDMIHYKFTKTGVEIEKANQATDDPFATFSEWSSDADERAYSKLR